MIETIPDKITLSTWQETKGNLFAYLIDTAQVSYFSGVDADTMQFLLDSQFGQRKVRLSFENKSSEEVGKYIHQVYSPRWQQEAELFTQFSDLAGDTVATVGTTRTTDTNHVNQTSGFDGSEMVDDNGTSITGSDASTNTSTNTSQQGLLSKAAAARQHQFHNRVCEDIARFITLSIY